MEFPAGGRDRTIPRSVSFTPRLVVNNVHAAIASVVEGHGVARLLSYHVAPELEQDALRIVLADAEPEPIPVHLVSPYGRLSVPKVRAFVDFALPRLRARFARLRPHEPRPAITSFCGRMSADDVDSQAGVALLDWGLSESPTSTSDASPQSSSQSP